MSTKSNDGGPAFPVGFREYDQKIHGKAPALGLAGMSLRAYFAGQALNGMLASESTGDGMMPANEPRATWEARTAERACDWADALIAELQKETP